MAMSMSDRGRLGGLATFRRHGTAHMSKIGKLGFAAFARRFREEGRRAARAYLQSKGKMRSLISPAEAAWTDEDTERLWDNLSGPECPY